VARAPLGRALKGRIGLEMRMIISGGDRILTKIMQAQCDVFRHRPLLHAYDWPLIWHDLFDALNESRTLNAESCLLPFVTPINIASKKRRRAARVFTTASCFCRLNARRRDYRTLAFCRRSTTSSTSART